MGHISSGEQLTSLEVLSVESLNGLPPLGVGYAIVKTGVGTFAQVAFGSGSVTAVSIVTANGFAGSSSGGSTPALTLTTTVTGILKGNGTAIVAATAGTDYLAPSGALTTGSVLFANSSGQADQDNGNFFYNSSTHQLALGTNTATNTLTINGDITMPYIRTINLTRTIPTTVGNEVDIGAFTLTDGSANLEIWLTVPSGGYSQNKRYFLPVSYNATNNAWQKVIPIATTGPYTGNDVDLEINVNNFVASLRLRRSSGTTAGTADVTMFHQGVVADSWVPSTSTGSVTAPTVAYAATIISQFNGAVGFGLDNPTATYQFSATPGGSYAMNAWAGGSYVVPMFVKASTANGGSSPGASVPVLVLGRDGVSGQSYPNLAEFKVARSSNNGTKSMTQLDIALTKGDGDTSGTNVLSMLSTGQVGISTVAPTAQLHIAAGTATASTAPIKLTSGVLLTTPEAGTIEFVTDTFYATITTGPARKTFAFIDVATLSSLVSVGTITTGTWNATTIDVAHGGTGNTTFTAYAVILAGTTSTGAFQDVGALGTSGDVLTSQGPGTKPHWVTPSSAPTNFADNIFYIYDDGDNTKKIAFQASGITTGTTRTLTVQDANGTIALTGNNLSVFASTTSAQLAGVISDETGTGVLVFGTAPTFTTSITLSAANIITDTTTGTKIGTGTTQKLGFFNATPVVQQTGDVVTALQNLGLVASATITATTITSRTLWGQTYDGSANVTGSLTAVGNITGGASSMTIVAGTGASRTLTFQTTTSGSTATTALTLGADQSATFAGHLVVEGVTSTGATGTGKFVFDASPTITGHPTIEGVTSTGATGTGSFVFGTGPTLSNPVVGTQTASDNSTKAASTAYVTTAIANAIAGVNPAVAVQAATTAAGDTSSLTYNNGVSGVGATLTGSNNTALTIDGFTFTALGQRLLVKNDTQSPSGAYNGVYYVTQIQTAILPPILTRALDYDMPSDINNTGAIPVVNGTVNATTSWLLTSAVTTVGTDPLTYTQFSRSPTSVLPPNLGGTGVANNASSTITISGSFGLTLTIAGTTSLTLPASGTVTALGNTVTGSGSIVLATSPTLVTPVLGVATATSINSLTISTSTGTLTITNLKTVSHTSTTTFGGVDGKTVAFNNSLTFAGTDSTTMTFPSTSATIARTDASNTFTGHQTIEGVTSTGATGTGNFVFATAPAMSAIAATGIGTADLWAPNNNAVSVTSNAGTCSQSFEVNTFTNSSAATMAITLGVTSPTPKDGQKMLVRIYDFSAVAQTIGWTNTENSTVSAPTTSNGSTTLPLTVGFMYNGLTSKWRCVASA